MSQRDLDNITDAVLAHNPAKQQELPLEVIAGAPDRPLVIGEVEIPCYVLEDETRVLAQKGLFLGMGISRAGPREVGTRMPRFMASKAINPFISNELRYGLENPILFKSSGGGNAYGYPATILVEICSTVLAAHDAGKTTVQQETIVKRCQALIRGLAKVGIIALVDEATGYQQIREERALAAILEKFIAEELQRWTRTFPFEFYKQICRLKDWPDVHAIKRPSVIGKYTNDIVYDRLAPGVLHELQRINPVDPDTGRRLHKHHQWFTPDIGHPKLLQHLSGVMALMRISPNWNSFKNKLDTAYPKVGDTIPLPLDYED